MATSAPTVIRDNKKIRFIGFVAGIETIVLDVDAAAAFENIFCGEKIKSIQILGRFFCRQGYCGNTKSPAT